MEISVIVCLLVILLAIWIVSVRKKLAIMDENEYIKCMDAVECYEKMVQTSRLIYNDSVTKLNRELHIFPTSVLAHMLGFEKRDYLVEN